MNDQETQGNASSLMKTAVLTGDNLTEWEGDFMAMMRIKNYKVFKMIRDGAKGKSENEKQEDQESDELARAYLLLSVAKKLKPHVRKAATAKDAIVSLRNACRGTEALYKAKLEKKEHNFKQDDDEALEDYGQRYMELYSEMEGLGIQPTEKKAIDHVLNGINAEVHEGFKRQIGTIRELKPLTLAEFVSKMIDEDREEKQKESSFNGLNGVGMSAVIGKQSCRRCGETDHWVSKCPVQSAKCNYCGKPGHLEKACRNKQQQGAVSNAAVATSSSDITSKAFVTMSKTDLMELAKEAVTAYQIMYPNFDKFSG